MNINTDSWHYKLNRYSWGEDVPEHLCPYARLLLFNILIGGWLQWIFNNVNINFEFPHLGIQRFIHEHKWIFNLEVVYALWSMLGIWNILKGEIGIGIFNLGLTGGCYLLFMKGGYLVKKLESKSQVFKGVSEKSVVLQSIKSNHDKICPKLDFIDTKVVKFNEDVIKAKNTLENVLRDHEKKNLLEQDSVEKKNIET